jgi:hypothetical protein
MGQSVIKWFAALHSEGKPMNGPVIIEKPKYCCDEIRITCNCTLLRALTKNNLQELRSVWIQSDNPAPIRSCGCWFKRIVLQLILDMGYVSLPPVFANYCFKYHGSIVIH